MTNKTEQGAAEAGWLRVLMDYLLCFRPAEAPGPGVEIKSTDEIINDLATMAELEPNPVADTLATMGFHSYHGSNGQHGWLMQRISE